MMNQKTKLDEILDELNFSAEERDAFKKCINIVKNESTEQNVEDVIKSIINEVIRK